MAFFKFTRLFPKADMLYFVIVERLVFDEETMLSLENKKFWESYQRVAHLNLPESDYAMWFNEKDGEKIKFLEKLVENSSLYEDEFEKLFPNYDKRYFLITRDKKIFYLDGNTRLSLYDDKFWAIRKNVLFLNLDSRAMKLWASNKLKFLENYIGIDTVPSSEASSIRPTPSSSSILPTVTSSIVESISKVTSTVVNVSENVVETIAEDTEKFVREEKPLGGLVLLLVVGVVIMMKIK